jgi:protein lifeguard
MMQYGVSVSESAPEIRAAFVRKVYTILCESCSIHLLSGVSEQSHSLPDCEKFLYV